MDIIVQKLVALGTPALVLVIAIATTGLAGGAAIVSALAVLGGPLGMLGGIALLGLTALTADALARFGLDRLFAGVVDGLLAKGRTVDQIRRDVQSYPISRSMKRRVLERLLR
jgi:hypothetical protein